MLNRTFDKISRIRNVTEFKLPILFFGFAVWVSFPILGIFPFLLYIQLDLLEPNKRRDHLFSFNSLLLLIVVLTMGIYLSAFDIFADTQNYLDIYDGLNRNAFWDNYIADDRMEVVLFAFFAFVHFLSNESTFWLLFSFALFNNGLIAFFISKQLSPRYYPTLLIILFSTFFYYSQVFYMRQFFSLVFVMAAIASMELSWLLFIMFALLAVFCHTSSIMFIFICLVAQGFGVLRNFASRFRWEQKDKIILYLAVGLIIASILYLGIQVYNEPKSIYGFINRVLEYLPQGQIVRSVQGRIENNDQRDVKIFEITIFLLIAIFSLLSFIVRRNYRKISPKMLSLIIIFFVSMLQILFILVTGFNQRIAYLFLAFYGLFFCIGLDDQKLNQPGKVKNFTFVSALTIFMAASNTFKFIDIQIKMGDIVGWSFFDKQPLSMSLLDYIVYFFQSM